MTDVDPTLIADLEEAAGVLTRIVELVPDRPLTAEEKALLAAVYAATMELHGSITVLLSEGDDGVVVRMAMGGQPTARA